MPYKVSSFKYYVAPTQRWHIFNSKDKSVAFATSITMANKITKALNQLDANAIKIKANTYKR